jgi:tetratricopeptide (TPR) repeat protein
MTPAACGLAHASFLERYARQSTDKSRDARLARATFVALRLVDLLEADHARVPRDAFHYQYAALERLADQLPPNCPETRHIQGLVSGAWDAFQRQDVRLAVPALLAYAHYLEDELRLEEALDVLETLLRVGGDRLGSSDSIAAQLRMGRVNRKLNRFDEGEAAYGAAGALAGAAGDVHAVLLSRAGRAIALQSRGNLAEAERSLREIAAEGHIRAHRDLEGGVLHALGTTLALRGQFDEAAASVWRAFQLYEDESSRLRAIKDLGSLLVALGRVADAESALREVVRRGGARDNVTNALIELMHCASYRRDRLRFQRLRAQCGSRIDEMPPNILADFYLKAGIGSARFGDWRKASALITEALSIARKNGLHELEFRAERIMAGLHDCETELAVKEDPGAEPAVASEALQTVSASLAKFEDRAVY